MSPFQVSSDDGEGNSGDLDLQAALQASMQELSVSGGIAGTDDDDDSGDAEEPGEVQDIDAFLLTFFHFDQAAFVLAMTVVAVVLVSTMPKRSAKDRHVAAGRLWMKLFLLSVLLWLAIAAGVLAFFFALLHIFPGRANENVKPWFVIACVFYLLVSIYWGSTLWRMFPRGGALRKAFDRNAELEQPVPSLEELLQRLVQQTEQQAEREADQVKALWELNKRMRDHTAQLALLPGAVAGPGPAPPGAAAGPAP